MAIARGHQGQDRGGDRSGRRHAGHRAGHARTCAPGAVRRAAPVLPDDLHEATRLSIFVGRGRRTGRRLRPSSRCATCCTGAASHGATVLLGVDGTVRGARKRAGFFGGNLDVPAMVLAVGGGPQVSAALPELSALLPDATAHAGAGDDLQAGRPAPAAPTTTAGHRHPRPAGVAEDQRLQLGGGRSDGRPLHRTLTRELQRAGAGGVTSLRGVWGFHGDHRPHGDRLWQVGRRVPTVTVTIDRPENGGPAVPGHRRAHRARRTGGQRARADRAGSGRPRPTNPVPSPTRRSPHRLAPPGTVAGDPGGPGGGHRAWQEQGCSEPDEADYAQRSNREPVGALQASW